MQIIINAVVVGFDVFKKSLDALLYQIINFVVVPVPVSGSSSASVPVFAGNDFSHARRVGCGLACPFWICAARLRPSRLSCSCLRWSSLYPSPVRFCGRGLWLGQRAAVSKPPEIFGDAWQNAAFLALYMIAFLPFRTYTTMPCLKPVSAY